MKSIEFIFKIIIIILNTKNENSKKLHYINENSNCLFMNTHNITSRKPNLKKHNKVSKLVGKIRADKIFINPSKILNI